MDIISRSQWDARPWNGQPYDAEMHERTHFLVHYHGGSDPNDQYGDAYPREIERGHLANGWSGIGYNFVVSQDGTIYEGRGWDLVGAHCPGKNRTGIGVQIGIGGDTEPTDAAKRSVLWLYAEAERRAGHSLTTGVHGDYYATLCAGNPTDRWVHSGMPTPSSGGTQDVPWTAPAPEPQEERYWQPTSKRSTKEIQEIVGVKVDGYYGEATKAAVRDLQKRLGVEADGYFGPATEAAYEKSLRKSKPKRDRLVVDGLLGPATYRALQEWVGVKQDGIYGPATRRGLQRKLGVKVDGIVGPVTVRALQRRVGASVDGVWGRMTTRTLQRYLNKVLS